MKGASDFVALLRLIMYDIIGLVVPGLAFLFLLLEYSSMTNTLSGLRSRLGTETTPQIVTVLVAAYLLGYLLQAVSYHHFRFLEEFGSRLLRKPKGGGATQETGISAAGRFTSKYFENTDFFRMAKPRIAAAAGIEDASNLKYNDIQNLAFSVAGDEAEKARHFRFRSDLCGGISTLAILHVLVIIPLCSITTEFHHLWWSIPVLILMWLFFFWKKPTGWVADRFWWVAPLVILGWFYGLVRWAGQIPHLWWTIPFGVLVWYFFLFRSYFYGDIGGRIVFYIALAEASRVKKIE